MERLISISQDNIEEISSRYFKESCTVLYGAGGNGIRLLSILKKQGIPVQYFCDDDFNKVDTNVEGIPVISFEQLRKLSENKAMDGQTINVVLTSVFSGPILKKLKDISGVRVFELFAMLMQEFFPKSFYNEALDDNERFDILQKFDQVIPHLHDDESQYVMKIIHDVIAAQDNADNHKFIEIASDEDCYFISNVCASLPEQPVVVDCGGFTGDLMVALEKHEIKYKKVFSFEPNPRLYEEMCENVRRNHLEDRFIPFHKGVWDSEGNAYLNFSEGNIAGGKLDLSKSGTCVEIISIDGFFKKQPVDFIKMDIEGAELHALRGGITTIQRDRPILAISLYHSPHDVVDIPIYLMDELEHYIFMVRHHSFIGSETVLYAIPEEKMSLNKEMKG